jgi:hypothetical protein
MAGGHIASIDRKSVAVVMVGTPQKLRRLGAIAPAVALVFGLQAVGAQAHVRAGSIVSGIPLGASMPRGGGTARAPRTRAVAPRTSSWPARGSAEAALLATPAPSAPGTSILGASPAGATPASAEPTVTAPTAGASPPAQSTTAGSPPADTTPAAGGSPAGGTPTTGTDPEHPTGGGAHGAGPHPNGTRPAGTDPHSPRPAATPAPTTHDGATKPVATKPVATKPVATWPVATQPAATPSAASQPQPTPPQPAAPTPTGPAATAPAATPPVATRPVATPAVANLSGSVSIAPGPSKSSGFSEGTAPSRLRRLLAGLALEVDRLAAAGNRRAVVTPLRRELGSLIAAVRSLSPADPAARPLAARLEQLSRVLAHLRGADGAAIRPLGPRLLVLRALTTQLMRAGGEAATSQQPALSAAPSADSVLLAPSSSFMDTTSGLAASVRVLASSEQGNDSAPHRRLDAMPSTSQLVPVPAPSSQGGSSPVSGAAGLSGGIGTAGPPSIALVAVLALAMSILLSKRLAMDPEQWPSIVLPLQLERPG